MTRLLAALASTTLVAATATGQALAGPAEKVSSGLRTEQVWFTCPAAGTGLGQLDGTAGWSSEAPDGGGCGFADTGHHASEAGDSSVDAVFRGRFTGNLDRLTVRLHLDRPIESDMTDIAVGLDVDGAERVPWPTSATAIGTEDTPPGVVEVSVYGIGLLDEADNVAHDLTLTLSLRGEVATGAWHWGSTDTPSGITFHPPYLAETIIRASDGTAPPPDDPTAAPVGSAIVAGPQSQTIGFFTPTMAMISGTTLTFANTDHMAHDVTSQGRGADGKPLFRAAVTTTGTTTMVTGAELLPSGFYGFYCSLHPNMTGNLAVAGSVPAPH